MGLHDVGVYTLEDLRRCVLQTTRFDDGVLRAKSSKLRDIARKHCRHVDEIWGSKRRTLVRRHALIGVRLFQLRAETIDFTNVVEP